MKPFFEGHPSANGSESAAAKSQASSRWPIFRRSTLSATPRAPRTASRLAALRARLAGGEKPWLLLAWDISSLQAAVYVAEAGQGRVVATANSRQARFADALDEVLPALARQSASMPRQVALAARCLLPGVVNLPVAPDKPRPVRQMRELIHGELEPLLAEFGSLWSLGALLHARGHLSAGDRERITLEEALRREGRRTPLRFGETALEMALIDRTALDECLGLQEHLQNLDANLVSGWRGRLEANHPCWLGCGVGAINHRQWQEALAERSLRLEACLPLAWLASEAEPETEEQRDGPAATICLELHQEEVVAVHRQNGRVLATRSEGRMERVLQADWLAGLVADWTSEARIGLELICLHADDEAVAPGLGDELALYTGHPTRLRSVAESWQCLWLNLAGEAGAQAPRLPRIVERELRGSRWNDHDFRRLAAIAAVIVGVGIGEGVQQYKLYRLNVMVAEKSRLEKEKSLTAQRESQFNAELNELARDLDATRKALEPLLNDRERLSNIVTMRQNLPRLLLMLAQAVGNDAVLDSLRNSKVGSNVTSIQVVAWSPSYTGAQAFVSRIAELTRELGYGVSQTEIVERKGRTNKLGHEVNFWLVPESDDLEGASATAQPPLNTSPAAGTSGISAGVAPAPLRP